MNGNGSKANKKRALVLAVFLGAAGASTGGEPAAHWKFEESAGTVYDATANHNNATPHNGVIFRQPGAPLALSGVYSLQFDGVNDYVDAPDAAGLDVGNAFTLAFWVKSTTGLGAEEGKNHGGVGKGFAYRLIWQGWHDGWQLDFRSSGTVNQQSLVVANSPLVADTWYHMAGTYDGGVLKIYRNGIEIGSKTVGAFPVDNTGESLDIGGDWWVGYLKGSLDDVRIYDHALTQDEVKGLILNKNIVTVVCIR